LFELIPINAPPLQFTLSIESNSILVQLVVAPVLSRNPFLGFFLQKKHLMAKERKDLVYSEIVRCSFDYDPTEPGCLQLKAGDLIYVHNKDSTGWWNGSTGSITNTRTGLKN
jgi:hypothetical protein